MTRDTLPLFEFRVFIDLDHIFSGKAPKSEDALYVCREELRVAGEGAMDEMEKRLGEVLK